MTRFSCLAAASLIALSACNQAHAAGSCDALPNYAALKTAVTDARKQNNGGLNNDMWGAVVDRTGQVCAVVSTGKAMGDQWPGSRAIAVEKANTANAFSLPNFALSTSNLYAGSQPGGFLFGIVTTNPVDGKAITAGDAATYGTMKDPLVGQRPGGVVVFGGGLALYDEKGTLVGALGVSGDTSCADNNIAWRARHGLKLDHVPAGPSSKGNDSIIYDIGMTGGSASGFGQPKCGGKEDDIAKTLPDTAPAKKG